MSISCGRERGNGLVNVGAKSRCVACSRFVLRILVGETVRELVLEPVPGLLRLRDGDR